MQSLKLRYQAAGRRSDAARDAVFAAGKVDWRTTLGEALARVSEPVRVEYHGATEAFRACVREAERRGVTTLFWD